MVSKSSPKKMRIFISMIYIYIWRNKGREDVSDLPEELTWLRAEVALVQMPLNFCAVFAPRFVVTEEAGMQKTQ